MALAYTIIHICSKMEFWTYGSETFKKGWTSDSGRIPYGDVVRIQDRYPKIVRIAVFSREQGT